LDIEALLAAIRASLEAIATQRCYDNEHAYQGQLLVELSNRLAGWIAEDGLLLEPEHQKTLANHGLTIRPDLIIHQPFDPHIHANRRQGNIAAFELKRLASPKAAREDFASLAAMIRVLEYPLGVFINIGSARSHVDLVPPEVHGKIIIYSTRLLQGRPSVIETRT